MSTRRNNALAFGARARGRSCGQHGRNENKHIRKVYMKSPQCPAENVPHAAQRASDIAHRCEKAKAKGDGWLVCCPAHDDTTPSLSIDAKGDKVLLNCFAGCEYDAIVQALG